MGNLVDVISPTQTRATSLPRPLPPNFFGPAERPPTTSSQMYLRFGQSLFPLGSADQQEFIFLNRCSAPHRLTQLIFSWFSIPTISSRNRPKPTTSRF